MVRHKYDQSTYPDVSGKSVSCRSRAVGSITVEAALCLPLFFLAAMLLMMLLEMAVISLRVENAAQYAAQTLAGEQISAPSADPSRLTALMVSAVGAERLNRSLVAGGSGGISTGESTMDPVTGIGYVRWKYRVRMPFPIFGSAAGEYKGELRYKAWNGFHGSDAASDEEMVYVARNGVVYHKNPSCTHLALSITSVSVHNLSTCRNENGGKYYPCEYCGGAVNAEGTAFITKDGDRYHSTRGCCGLKRTVDKIPISQVGGRAPCSRCSQ